MKTKSKNRIVFSLFFFTFLLFACKHDESEKIVANNPPSIINPQNLSITSNSKTVTTIKALDADNDSLNFTISGGADAKQFVIDFQTGVLSFNEVPNVIGPTDTDKNTIYDVEVSVSDATSTTTQTFKIFVQPIPIEFDQSDYDKANVVRGGRLYDNWWREKNVSKPSSDNPIWEKVLERFPENTINNENQWRCKECHGWDYKGHSGTYNEDSDHYTDIPGLSKTNLQYNVKNIFFAIVNGSVNYGSINEISHQFTGLDLLNLADTYDLTKFIFQIARLSETNTFEGNKSKGVEIFNNIPNDNNRSCTYVSCHTESSSLTPSLEQIINLAFQDPNKFLHKLRFGSPGTNMPSGMNKNDAEDVLAFVAAGASSTNTTESDFHQQTYDNTTRDDVVLGGKLYDNWWSVTSDVDTPINTHPLWPMANSTMSNEDTWRCQVCHGWDYRGNNAIGMGAIVNTTNYNVQAKSPLETYKYLQSNTNHGFNSQFSSTEYYALTKFIMTIREEFNMSQSTSHFINNATRLVKNNTDINIGKSLYETTNTMSCASLSCHGMNGKGINLADANQPTFSTAYLHNIALEEPWKFVHKIRFGLPDTSAMPPLFSANDSAISSIQSAANILAYAQTELSPDVRRGGLLYDNWQNVDGVKLQFASGRNQSWIASMGTSNTSLVSNRETWRCVTCHGWDYQGAEGEFNGDHNYFSNILGFIPTLNTKNKDKSYIVDLIKNGGINAPIKDHDFGRFLSDVDISNLASFILDQDEGVPSSVNDYEDYLRNGDPSNGKIIYESFNEGNCVFCHGPNGTSVSGVHLSEIANNHPQKLLQKARFGQPGTGMLPSNLNFNGMNLQDASDVLAYTKTLP